jgi:hypothetical protein
MANLNGQSGELRFTIEIKRKDTGRVETVELVGKITADEAQHLGLLEDLNDGSHPQHDGA